MYEMSCKVRFSETDRNGVMSMNGLLRLFQDVGYAHALERGFGLEYTGRTRCTWYLLSWQIEAFRMPRVRIRSKRSIRWTFRLSRENLSQLSESQVPVKVHYFICLEGLTPRQKAVLL